MDTRIEIERRQRRSSKTQPAVTFQLEQVHGEFGLHAAILTTPDGHFIAGSMDAGRDYVHASYIASIIGACGPARDEIVRELLASEFPGTCNLDVRVHEIWLGPERAYLGLIGTPTADFRAAAERAINGTRRIFATT